MKQLILVRHAKSDWPNVSDIDRPLTQRGTDDCSAAANYFQNLTDLLDFEVHVSIAKRTQETWQNISKDFNKDPNNQIATEIYEVSLGELVAYLDSQTAEKMIFVGHNPGMARLGSYLTEAPVLSFPTLSIWHLTTEESWMQGSAKTLHQFVARADDTNPDSD